MNKQTIHTKYRFTGVNNLVFADDNKFYLSDSFKEIKVRYKNGRNGLYLNRKFVSLKRLRILAYEHNEIIKNKLVADCPLKKTNYVKKTDNKR